MKSINDYVTKSPTNLSFLEGLKGLIKMKNALEKGRSRHRNLIKNKQTVCKTENMKRLMLFSERRCYTKQ